MIWKLFRKSIVTASVSFPVTLYVCATLLATSAATLMAAYAATSDTLEVRSTTQNANHETFKINGSLEHRLKAVQPPYIELAQSVLPAPIRSNFEGGMNALKALDMPRALGILAAMAPGSVERKALGWALLLSKGNDLSLSVFDQLAIETHDWPGRGSIAIKREAALVEAQLTPRETIAEFGNRAPVSVSGAIALAEAHLAVGNRAAARIAIAPFWRDEVLSRSEERQVLNRFEALFNREDHRHRMHMLFYRDRAEAGLRVGPLAEQTSLGKARAAALRGSSDGVARLLGVAESSKQDPGYLFARIERARRAGDYLHAAKLLTKRPQNSEALVDPDEWWTEQRIVSRQLIELGRYREAYTMAADHAGESPQARVEGEFHAGWYALRFLKDPERARAHFSRILRIAKRPQSLSRGHYWLARASMGADQRAHFQQAARYQTVFYGQLAAAELGRNRLSITRPRPSNADREAFEANEFVGAARLFDTQSDTGYADALYRHLGRTLDSPGVLALVSLEAERKGRLPLALQVGRLAHARGLNVETLAWPIGAIPSNARIDGAGKALAYAIARQESAFNKAAISRANARGLLQLLPGTARQVAKTSGLPYSAARLTTDAGYNATLGAAYLTQQLDKFSGSYVLTFAAYNAGPRKAAEWVERFGDPSGKRLYQVIDWIEQIPYSETRSYVQRVMENYQVYKARLSGTPLTIQQDLTQGRR